MSTTKLAVVGRIRSGKNTVADYITKKYGHEQYAFADGIKGVIYKYFPEAILKGKPRKHYQVIGQAFRELKPDIWIKMLQNQLRNAELFNQYHPVVVTDLRQENEYEALKEMGFTIIKVEADEEVRIQRMKESGDVFTPETLNHETEIQAEDCPYDYLITNNTTLDELYQQVDFIIEDLIKEGVN